MSKLRYLIIAPVLAISIIGAVASSNVAAADTTTCTVKAVGAKNTAGASDSRFVLNNDNTATVAFMVSGTACDEEVTFASWSAPDGDKGLPYSAQKLFASTTGAFGAGTHTLTVALPGEDCFYQLDLVPGSNATDSKGGPEYFAVDGIHILGSLHGGSQVCEGGQGGGETTPETPTTLPNTGSPLSTVATLAIASSVIGTFVARGRLARKNA